ncbi:MAG: GyrI-like domain-containing protein [Bacteroidales bacterium]|nr:GyrI-like domain-containing protein [Bacteroidales bacterium]
MADLNNWANWFKEIKQDSCCKISVTEATDTSKAKITWQAKHGGGVLILKKSVKDSLLGFRVKLHHHKKACLKWLFQPIGDSTQVTVLFDFNLYYPVGRILGIFMKNRFIKFMETMIVSYQTFVEILPREMPQMEKQVNFEEITVEAKPALSVEINTDMSHISEEMSKAYGQIMEYIKTNGLEVVGAPFSFYQKWNPPTEVVFVAGVPVNKTAKGNDVIKPYETPSGKMLKVVHFGAYDQTAYIYNGYDEYAAKNGLETRGGPWEEYITDPTQEPDTTKWQTNIYFQIK